MVNRVERISYKSRAKKQRRRGRSRLRASSNCLTTGKLQGLIQDAGQHVPNQDPSLGVCQPIGRGGSHRGRAYIPAEPRNGERSGVSKDRNGGAISPPLLVIRCEEQKQDLQKKVENALVKKRGRRRKRGRAL